MPPMENLADIAEARAAPRRQPGYPRMTHRGFAPRYGHPRPAFMAPRVEAEKYSPYEDTGYPYEDEHAIAGTVHPAIAGMLQRLAEKGGPLTGRQQQFGTQYPPEARPSLDLDLGRIQQPPSSTYHQYDNPLFEEAADMARRREMEEEEKRWHTQKLLQELSEQDDQFPFSGPTA